MTKRTILMAVIAAGLWAFSCDSSTEVVEGVGASGPGTGGSGASNSGGAGQGGSGATASGGAGGVGPPPTEIAMCQNFIYECGDLVDNDNDGLIDSQDPDCLGPCDNTEGSLFGGIPGQNASPCTQDCYWDHDTGHGNDKCYWSHWCDPNSTAPEYYPEPQNGATCAYDEDRLVPVSEGPPRSCDDLFSAQGTDCIDYCEPLTPNGCDCFGCCELPAGSGKHVWLGSVGADGDTVCTFAEIDNPEVCHPCLQVDSCVNDCGTCELCVGKTTLPPECYDPPGSGGSGGGSPQDCPDEFPQACGLPGQDPCPAGSFCLTGCCVPNPQ